ncbi:MAG: SH3 domain-containing protein, partial [Chloroflexi bacterium]|nr:SH3 domain-containing protein [Chloroflexota bacterium]
DIAEGFSTDGRGIAWGFHNLADTLNFFPFYNPAPVVRKAVIDANPELKTALNSFIGLLDDTTMSQLNARVDIGADGIAGTGDEETPEAVAQDFLLKNRVILASTSLTETTPSSLSTTGAAAIKANQAVTTSVNISATEPVTGPAPIAPTKAVTATETVTDTRAPTEPLSSTSATEPTEAVATAVMTTSVVALATPSVTATVGITDGVLISTPGAYGVNARATASTDAPIVQLLPRGNLLRATGRTADGTWLEVTLTNGRSAWIFTAAILARQDAIETLPIVTPPPLAQ